MTRATKSSGRHESQETPEMKLSRMIGELNSRGNGRKEFHAKVITSNGERFEAIMTGALHRAGSPIQLVNVSPHAATGYPYPTRTIVIHAQALQGA
ncbi:hypothetical protein [Glutamicibacter sp. TV12E]|uniref:hypothetical protein n=1 Tax=Glutamicibacter sp. TV12E TaxID=3446362 RepID=UPI004034B06A